MLMVQFRAVLERSVDSPLTGTVKLCHRVNWEGSVCCRADICQIGKGKKKKKIKIPKLEHQASFLFLFFLLILRTKQFHFRVELQSFLDFCEHCNGAPHG